MVGKKSSKEKSIGLGLGIAGFVLGILSIVLAGPIGIPLAVVGFALCFVQQKRNPTKLGKAGIILSIIGFVLSLVWIYYLAPLTQEWLNKILAQNG